MIIISILFSLVHNLKYYHCHNSFDHIHDGQRYLLVHIGKCYGKLPLTLALFIMYAKLYSLKALLYDTIQTNSLLVHSRNEESQRYNVGVRIQKHTNALQVEHSIGLLRLDWSKTRGSWRSIQVFRVAP